MQAVILYRQGYDTWSWEDRALLRAYRWLHEQAGYAAHGDDTWQPHLLNHYYGARFPAPVPSDPGKNVGWTNWTHGAAEAAPCELPGDLDRDGRLAAADLRQMPDIILRLQPRVACADLDGDGEVCVQDLQRLVNLLLAP